MNATALLAFLASSTALLGSPGPGIVSLIAVGRAEGFLRGFRFFAGLQLGLAVAAALAGLGVLSVIATVPAAQVAMQLGASAYLLYLAWRIAWSPGGAPAQERRTVSTFGGGLFLGLSNPKSLLAFATLFGTQAILADHPRADAAVKWILVVIVMFIVDLLWLAAGVLMRGAVLTARAERVVNLVLALALVAAVAAGTDWSSLLRSP